MANSAAIPVVLIHDLGGSASDWSLARVELEAAGFTVITPDLPGHGNRGDEPMTVESLFDTVAAAVIESARAPVLVGAGVGGHLVITQGASSRGVIAVGCGTEPLTWALDSYRIAAAATSLLADGGSTLSAQVGQSFGTANSPAFRAVVEAIGRLDVRAGLGALRVPVRLINGRRDRFRMQERAFLRAASQSSLVRVRGLAVPSSPALVAALGTTVREIASDASTR